jgi:hypothetical protein
MNVMSVMNVMNSDLDLVSIKPTSSLICTIFT